MTFETTTPVPKNKTSKNSPAKKMPVTKKRILIIEDEYSASKFLTLRLKNLGFQVTAAFDGMTGLKPGALAIAADAHGAVISIAGQAVVTATPEDARQRGVVQLPDVLRLHKVLEPVASEPSE